MAKLPNIYKVLPDESIQKMIDGHKAQISRMNSQVALLNRELKRRKRLTRNDKLN